MEFKFTETQDKLRAEVRSFLEEELKHGSFEPSNDAWIDGYSKEFSRKVGAKGWIGTIWPKGYGGKEWSFVDRLIITEELLRFGAPVAYHWMSDRQCGPCVIAYGSDEQRKDILPRIIKGEVSFALGMSEPDSGSDLASLQTRAVETEDAFIINGQKIWTSGAHEADYIYLVARTDPDVPKHKGISEFIVDLKLPGITVKPIVDMMNSHHFNEVYFDSVRVPKSALVGERNRGWYQIAVQLDYERSGLERIMSPYPMFHMMLDLARQEPVLYNNPEVRHKLTDLVVKFEVGRLLIYRVAWTLSQGRVPNFESAMAKIYGTAFEQHLSHMATQVLGLSGQLMEDSRWAPLRGLASRSYLFCAGATLRGGTSEILRNIVALRGLGLPSQ
ncbi:MAG: acyl-CoA dehydrogenase family protein [Dehalococcoidia bacterium]|jgi:alkylation response protein AidB-like acyl-CoA dehydrogenase|nr:acyl-CoA dehydrogenase family protein [Dehalococcoidia bacterium]